MIRILAIAVVACAAPAAVRAPPPSAPPVAAIGDTFVVDSKLLGERRVVNVYVPPDYATSHERYPVLYMPDGGMKEDFPHVVGSVDVSIKDAVIRPLIVVGIENTDRKRDLVTSSARFRAFLRDELRPLVAARYRTTAETAIVGESLAGLFVVETYLVEPALFDSYIAADPSVWWNDAALVHEANVDLVDHAPKPLYIATSSDADLDAMDMLATALRIAGLPWTYEPMPAEHHNSIFAIAALRGVRFAFAKPEP